MNDTQSTQAIMDSIGQRILNRSWVLALVLTAAWGGSTPASAASLNVPNFSFEAPQVPDTAPYAGPEMDAWQKTHQPAWYDPRQNSDTPWEYLSGQFYNVPFPGSYIENADQSQAAFLFAVPEVGIFQDYDSVYGTNTTPTHAFNAAYKPGKAYTLTASLLGGGGGMLPGATIQLGLYYKDANSNMVIVASTTVTNSPEVFTTNTLFKDFTVSTLIVRETNAWAGQHIGIRLLSTTAFELARGYWDVDNIRLVEIGGMTLSIKVNNAGESIIWVNGLPASVFELQSRTNLSTSGSAWESLGVYTNTTGTLTITNAPSASAARFFRARAL